MLLQTCCLMVPRKAASLNLILVWGIYVILFNIKSRLPVNSVIKKAMVLINLNSDRAGGWNHCLLEVKTRFKKGRAGGLAGVGWRDEEKKAYNCN